MKTQILNRVLHCDHDQHSVFLPNSFTTSVGQMRWSKQEDSGHLLQKEPSDRGLYWHHGQHGLLLLLEAFLYSNANQILFKV